MAIGPQRRSLALEQISRLAAMSSLHAVQSPGPPPRSERLVRIRAVSELNRCSSSSELGDEVGDAGS